MRRIKASRLILYIQDISAIFLLFCSDQIFVLDYWEALIL